MQFWKCNTGAADYRNQNHPYRYNL
jgi:hypothetical protein